MVLTPSASSSRLSILRNARDNSSKSMQTGINEFLKKKPILPQHNQPQPHQRNLKPEHVQNLPQKQRQRTPILTKSQTTTTSVIHGNKILDGVVACLDVRTEDGDDVSQNFERALQSMGAKTRRTFSDSVTHLIFKNGSHATLKKALSKNVFIINLLWISRCKREGKRLPEKDFIIERPQGLVLAGKKRRKSMEPGKVRALVDLEPSLSSSSDSSVNDDSTTKMDPRRKTIATSSWTARDFSRRDDESESRKRHIEEAELDTQQELRVPRLSLPISVESIASRHTDKKQKSSLSSNIIPVHAPSETMKEQIKARFSIGQVHETGISSIEETAKSLHINPMRLSLSSSSSTATPIKRKRRLTGNLGRPSISSTISDNRSNELPKLKNP